MSPDPAVKTIDQANGCFVICLPCSMKMRANGSYNVTVKMRHPFTVNAWSTHCKTTRHVLSFKMLMLHEPAGGQATMTAYFSARKRAATVRIVPVPPRVGSPPVVLEVAPLAPIFPLKPVQVS